MSEAPLTLRPATLADGEDIAAIMAAAWPEEEVPVARVAAALHEPGRETLVAVVEGRITGFVDSFETRAADGVRRWEVDLLAVHPATQRQGIGPRLINATTRAASERGIALSRALISSDNIASQRAFARCGYAVEGGVCELHLWTVPRPGSDSVLDPAEFPLSFRTEGGSSITNSNIIAVSTMRYRGLWVGGGWTEQQFAASKTLCLHEGHDMAGAVIPVDDAAAIRAAREAGFESAGRYHWWTCRL